jgi:hypothetical protein
MQFDLSVIARPSESFASFGFNYSPDIARTHAFDAVEKFDDGNGIGFRHSPKGCATYAKQLCRLLPGNQRVLGLFISIEKVPHFPQCGSIALRQF